MQQELENLKSALKIPDLSELLKRLSPSTLFTNKIDLNMKLYLVIQKMGIKVRKSDFNVKPRLDSITLQVLNSIMLQEIRLLENELGIDSIIINEHCSSTFSAIENNDIPDTVTDDDLRMIKVELQIEQEEYEKAKKRLMDIINTETSNEILQDLETLNTDLNGLLLELEYWNQLDFKPINYLEYERLVLDGGDYDLDLNVYDKGILSVEMYLDLFLKVFDEFK